MYREKEKKLLNFLITFMLICTSGVVQFTFIWNSQSTIFLFLFSVCLFVFGRNWKIPRKKMIKMILLSCIIMINLMVYSGNVDGHISLFLVVVSGCILSQFIEWKLFARYYGGDLHNKLGVFCVFRNESDEGDKHHTTCKVLECGKSLCTHL